MNFKPIEGFHIRRASNEDSHVIILLLKDVAQWMKDKGINQWQYLLAGGDDEEIIQAVSNNDTYLVLKDTQIIATFTLSSLQSEWDQHIFGKDELLNSLYLHRLAVIPKYMNQGIGRKVLNSIQDCFECDKEYIKLDCVASNSKLNDFYLSNGFEHIGNIDGHNKFQKKLDSNLCL